MFKSFFYYSIEVVSEIKEKYLLPTSEDYKGAIAGIQRLEDTYLLQPRDIRNGNLSEKYQSRPLTGSPKFCYDIYLLKKI